MKQSPKQASIPFKVFISYSRSDIAFADRLAVALESNEIGVLIDRRDLPVLEEWKRELLRLIEESDTVIFVISPRSITSQWCEWELAQVAALHKRLAPVVLEEVTSITIPESIKRINYLWFTADCDFGVALDRLVRALKVDHEWLQEHSRLGNLARRWESRGQSKTLLLRGLELEDAERWVARRPTEGPALSQEQLDWITESRRSARLQARRTVMGLALGIIGALSLASWAVYNRQSAIAAQRRTLEALENSRKLTEELKQKTVEREAALESEKRASRDLESQVGIAAEAQQRAEKEQQRAKAANAATQLSLERSQSLRLAAEGSRLAQTPRYAVGGLLAVEAAQLKSPVDASALETLRAYSEQSLVLRGQEGSILSAAWSPDGKRVITASADGTARIWNADGSGIPTILRGGSGDPVNVNGHQQRPVFFVAWSPDGKRVLTVSGDTRIWSVENAGVPVILQGQAVQPAPWSPDSKRVITLFVDVRIWNADGSAAPIVLRGHDGEDVFAYNPVMGAAWSPDGKRVITTSYDKTARIWNTDGSATPIVFSGHQGPVDSAAWSPDGKRVLTTSFDQTTRIWNADGLGSPTILRGHENAELTVANPRVVAAWSPDGKRVATAASDASVHIWNADGSGNPFILPFPAYTFLAWSPDGKRVITTTWEGTAHIWNATASGDPIILRGHESLVNSAAWSPDGRRVITASNDKTARIWNVDESANSSVLRGHENLVFFATWSPDGRRILTASEDKTARIWNVDASGDPVILRGHEDRVNSAAWSPDSTRVVTASQDKTARIWNADGSGNPVILRGHTSWVLSAAWSPDGKSVITGSSDGTAGIWQADCHSVTCSFMRVIFSGHGRSVYFAAWSPDGKHVITASEDRVARICSADGTGNPIILRGHESFVLSVAWSPDGKRLITASADRTARIWNADGSGNPVILRGHEDVVHSAAWSPDGKHVITGSQDNTARVWNARDGSLVDVLRDTMPFLSAQFSPNGLQIVTASGRSARIWPTDPMTLIPTICRGVGRNLTREEWARYIPDRPYRQTCAKYLQKQVPQ